MANITNFGDYSVKNVKTFKGHDGIGMNCDLYRGKTKIADCHDGAYGGEIEIRFFGENRRKEEDLLQEICASLPLVPFEHGDDYAVDMSSFVDDLANKALLEKDIKKMKKVCQTKTLFKTSTSKIGAYSIIPSPPSESIRAYIKEKFGECEIFNDVFERGEIPSVLKD